MTFFRKMQGLGNDFAVFDARNEPVPLTPESARRVADRHFGIGCDTVVLILPGSAQADASLRFFNADGGEVEACGNATRCVARLLMEERGLARVRIESKGGSLLCSDAGKGLVSVDMGTPGLDWRDIPLAQPMETAQFQFPLENRTITASAVSMGNPHCILLVGDAEKAPVAQLGPLIEKHPLFPERVNVEFAQVLDKNRIRMRVWERGVGITLACGTGAAATAVAAIRKGLAARKVEVILDGGSLALEWREADSHVLMTGPAVTSFTGEVDLERL
ncbi:MAG TPA: diaminopimelate epimerase [Rhizomicrobium sp.]|nr:diaminopimelate epimerase [Rhizomicrobium sp.]